MTDTIPTIGVAVFKGDSVLLVRKKNHPQQALQLPGGQLEPGEKLEEAGIRELYETTGLKGDLTQLVILPNEWYARIEKSYGIENFNLKCALCRRYEGSIQETRSAVPIWVERSELTELNLVPNTQAAIEAAEQSSKV